MTVDAQHDDPALDAVTGADLRRQIRQVSGKMMVFLDTCYAAALTAGLRTRDMDVNINRLISEFSSAETGAVVFSATGSGQKAVEIDTLQNGAFTAALLEVLAGQTLREMPRDRPVRLHELAALLSERVRGLSGGAQTPAMTPLDTVTDYPLFLVR